MRGFKDIVPDSIRGLFSRTEDKTMEDERNGNRTREAVDTNMDGLNGEDTGFGDNRDAGQPGTPTQDQPQDSTEETGGPEKPEDSGSVREGVPSTEAPESPQGEERDEMVKRGLKSEIESMDTEDLQDLSAHAHKEIAKRDGKSGLDETKKKDVVREDEALWAEDGEFRGMRDNAEELHGTELPSVSTVQRSEYAESDAAVTTLETQIISGIEEGRVADAIVSEYSEWDTAGMGDEYTHPKLVGLVQDTEHYDDIVGNEVTDLLDVIEHRGMVHDSATTVKGKVQNKIQTLRQKENQAETQEEYRNAERLKDELSSERNRLSDDIGTVIEETASDIDQEYTSEIRLDERLEEVNETVGVITDNTLNLFEEIADNLSKKANPITIGSEHGEDDNPYKNSAGYIQNFDMLEDKLEEATETLGGPFAEESEGLLDEMLEATSYFDEITDTVQDFGTEFYDGLKEASDLSQYETEFGDVLDSGYITAEDGEFTYGERAEELAEYTSEFDELRNTNPGEAAERAEEIVADLS